jgi:hypothetical protein
MCFSLISQEVESLFLSFFLSSLPLLFLSLFLSFSALYLYYIKGLILLICRNFPKIFLAVSRFPEGIEGNLAAR